eukprot:maker-scaffold94_size379870-snap-gene-1.14 protein:Tk09629 transcript:maker-scaffold94_size379870-snap-gene-1.14-mRNA-1 annotation:"hypothetical protein NEMVEDRAFT_v1g16904"
MRRQHTGEEEDEESKLVSSIPATNPTPLFTMDTTGRQRSSSGPNHTRCRGSTLKNISSLSTALVLFTFLSVICPAVIGYRVAPTQDYEDLTTLLEPGTQEGREVVDNALNQMEPEEVEDLFHELQAEVEVEDAAVGQLPWQYLLSNRPRRGQDDHLLRFGKRAQSPPLVKTASNDVPSRDSRSGNHLLRFSRAGSDHLLRFSKRDSTGHLLRFNRALDDEHMLRFGRSNPSDLEAHQQLRSARAGDEHLLRFSRSGDHLLRFSRDGGSDHLLRFSRNSPNHLLRFNRSPGKMLRSVRTPELLKRFNMDSSEAETNRLPDGDHLLRFSRTGSDHLLRFSKRSAGDSGHLLRFARGVKGSTLAWFKCVLSGGKQCVTWNGTTSNFVPVKYGMRQGSILGPVLYFILVADMPDCVGIGDRDNSGYADDT